MTPQPHNRTGLTAALALAIAAALAVGPPTGAAQSDVRAPTRATPPRPRR